MENEQASTAMSLKLQKSPDHAEDWKQHFRASTVVWTQLAANDPTRGIAVSNHEAGIFQLCAWEVPSGRLRPLAIRPTGRRSGQISPDGRYVYLFDDDQGNEYGHYQRLPFEGGALEDVTPGLSPFSTWGMTISRDSRRMAFTAADSEGYHVYITDIDIPLQTPVMIWQSEWLTYAPVLSQDGRLAALTTAHQAGSHHNKVVVVDAQTRGVVAELWMGEGTSCAPAIFSPVPQDPRLLVSITYSSTTSEQPLDTRVWLWNPLTDERIELPFPAMLGGIDVADWSSDGRYLLLAHLARATQQLYVYDLITQHTVPLAHPAGAFDFFGALGTYFVPNGEIFAQWQDSAHPSQLIALDESTGQLKRIVLPAGNVPPGHPWHSIEFPSSDGTLIQGWLSLPEANGPFPAIIEMHGGPEIAQLNEYAPRSQTWLDQGYAYLTINYRGSLSFGRTFQEQIWGDLGHWEVEDIVAARNWLVQQGIAQPAALFLTGWSYGGYLTLLTLGKYPQLWAGGMAGIVITDWAAGYEEAATSRMQGLMVTIFRGTPADKPDLYRRASPITYADQIRAPVLIMQGRHDTRCSPQQAEVFTRRLRSLGKSVELHWFEGGHGSQSAEEQIEQQVQMLRFAEHCRMTSVTA